jgi:lipoate-protein ligase A
MHDAGNRFARKPGVTGRPERTDRPQVNTDKLMIVPSPSRRTEPLRPAIWPARWQVLESEADSAPGNMATDLALLDQAGDRGGAVLRTYDWSRPSISFGRNEPVRDAWDVDAMRSAGYDVVRRPTGGRALLHGPEVTYSVTLPLPRGVPWRDAYDAVNARLADAIGRLGVPVTPIGTAAAPPVAPDGPACFAAPAAGELAVDGRKVAGSAVWRSPAAYLQHGAILLRDEQSALARFRPADRAPDAEVRAAGLTEFVPALVAADVIRALHAAWSADASIGAWAPPADEATAFRAARAVHHTTLVTPSWLWRR